MKTLKKYCKGREGKQILAALFLPLRPSCITPALQRDGCRMLYLFGPARPVPGLVLGNNRSGKERCCQSRWKIQSVPPQHHSRNQELCPQAALGQPLNPQEWRTGIKISQNWGKGQWAYKQDLLQSRHMDTFKPIRRWNKEKNAHSLLPLAQLGWPGAAGPPQKFPHWCVGCSHRSHTH